MSQPTSKPPKPRPGDPDYVGPGHPPKHSRIRPNEVRNPWGRAGRPKAEAAEDDFVSQMKTLLSRPVRGKDGQTFSHAEIILNGVIKQASEGDIRASKFYHELCRKYAAELVNVGALAAEVRQNALEEALARIAAKKQRVEVADHLDSDEPPSEE